MYFSYVCSVCACLDLSVSSSSWGLGRTAACDCGTPWTFLLPLLCNLIQIVYDTQLTVIQARTFRQRSTTTQSTVVAVTFLTEWCGIQWLFDLGLSHLGTFSINPRLSCSLTISPKTCNKAGSRIKRVLLTVFFIWLLLRLSVELSACLSRVTWHNSFHPGM